MTEKFTRDLTSSTQNLFEALNQMVECEDEEEEYGEEEEREERIIVQRVAQNEEEQEEAVDDPGDPVIQSILEDRKRLLQKLKMLDGLIMLVAIKIFHSTVTLESKCN
ncbi:hypothetical protein M8J77_020915 [Diaphorina citri]|nr:hypothetical protein M8J77_020915 [Diaphorina citri]